MLCQFLMSLKKEHDIIKIVILLKPLFQFILYRLSLIIPNLPGNIFPGIYGCKYALRNRAFSRSIQSCNHSNARQFNTCLFYFTHVPNLNFEHIFLTFKKQSLAYDYTHIIFPV